MARRSIRIVIAAAGVIAAGVSALLFAAGSSLLDAPEQKVGLHLEFSGEPEEIRADVATARVLLRRLLASTDARRVVVSDVDPATLEVTFIPAHPWSEEHGLLAEDRDTAPLLVPEELQGLLAEPRHLRILEVAEPDAVSESDVERRRFLEEHPERLGEELRRSSADAAREGRAIAWCPREEDRSDLVPLVVEGAAGRRITIVDLSWASHGAGPPDVEIRIERSRRDELEDYIEELAGRRAAVVVDGVIETVARVHAAGRDEIGLAGEEQPLSEASSTAVVDRIRRPPLPSRPRITRSWIVPTQTVRSAQFMFFLGTLVGIAAAAAVWAFMRDVRRLPPQPMPQDWSSGS